MPIFDIQRRIREVGRIRLGVQGQTADGRSYPKAIEHPRFTSRDRTVIEAVANAFGGEVKPWDNNGVSEWEVIVEVTSIPIALPPDPETMAFTQWYEQWGGRLCKHRCDGEWDRIADEACSCVAEDRDCQEVTRLSVLVPDVPGLGLWRLETHGYYAAVELLGAITLLGAMAGVHSIIPARLRIDRREVRRLIDGKPETRKFIVPVLDLDVSIKGVQALASGNGTGHETPVAIGPEPGWKPIAEAEPPALVPSVGDQLAELDRPAKPPRKGTTRLKPTGNAPRTAAQAKEGQTCSLCSKPLSGSPVVRNKGEGSRFVHRSCADQPGGAEHLSSAPSGEGGGEASPPVSPPRPVVPSPSRRGVSHEQIKNIMRLGADLFPVDPQEMTGTEARTYRREQVLGISRCLGAPAYDSRNDMDRATATVVIDTLEAIKAGAVSWDGERLTRTETGEIIGFEATGPVGSADA